MAAASAALAGSAPPTQDARSLRLAYAVSVAVLVVLALATLASPVLLPVLRREQATLPEAGKIQVLAKAGEWVLQYNLLNGTGQSGAYTFEITSAAPAEATGPATNSVFSPPLHTTSVLVEAGRSYVFIYHLRPQQVPDGTVRFTVHRGGEALPLEDLSLHLPPDGAGG